MRTFAVSAALGCALCLGFGAGPAEAHSPQGKTYRVTVIASFGTQFEDCFAFGRNGRLVIAGFGPIAYRFDELNSQPETWQATGTDGGPVGLAFHGTVGGDDARTINANGMSTVGDTFILQGVVDPGCAAGSVRSAGSPYRN